MLGARAIRMVTDSGVPGLVIYGLHRDLASDTDDTDYEPGKTKTTRIKKIKRKAQRKRARSIGSSSAEDEEDVARKRRKRNVSQRTSAKTAQSKMSKLGDSSDREDTTEEPNQNNDIVHQPETSVGLQIASLSREEATDTKWSRLPTEILSRIFRLVASSDNKGVRYLCRCARVCWHWRNTVSDPVSWWYVDLAFVGESRTKKNTDRTLKRLTDKYLCECRELTLSGWLYLTDEALSKVSKKCVKLETLNISRCQKGGVSKITSAVILEFAQNVRLKSINFSSVRIAMNYGKTMIKFFGTCGASLTSINMSDNVAFNSAVFKSIHKSCPLLKYLDVSNTSVRSVSIKELQENCPLIEELYMANLCLEIKESFADIKCYPGFEKLKILSVASTFQHDGIFDKVCFGLLKYAENLTILDVRGCGHVTFLDHKIAALKVERLYLSRCVIDEQLMSVIGAKWSQTLWELDLSKTLYVDFESVLAPLFEGASACVNLQNLDLSGTAISESSVVTILDCCRSLELIDLTSCRALPRGIKRIHTGPKDMAKLRKRLT